jgi:hypothetical protein
MRFKRRKRSEEANWALVAGMALTGAAAAYAISRLVRQGPIARRLELGGLEKQVLQTLLNDDVARNQGIDISAVGAGVIEITGAVETREQARHVVELIGEIPGVHAVLNRLQVRSVESRLKRNRKRSEGDESTRWYGGSVGIGKRRQSFNTDPARRDDRAAILERSLQPNRDDVLTDVEEMEDNGVRIGLSNSNSFSTRVAARSPNPKTDEPGFPPPAETLPSP